MDGIDYSDHLIDSEYQYIATPINDCFVYHYHVSYTQGASWQVTFFVRSQYKARIS